MISARTRFLAAPLAGVALVVSLAACGSSGGGGGGGSSSDFCSYAESHASAIQNASSGNGLQTLEDLANQAPSDIKPAFETLVNALKDPTSVSNPANASKLEKAAQQIANWGKTNCGNAFG